MKSHRVAANILFTAGLTFALIAMFLVTRASDRPPLTARPPVAELNDLVPDEVVPLSIWLHNTTRIPVRLVGALMT